jgi:hypothetical protein
VRVGVRARVRASTLPPLATTFAPRLAKAIVLPSASSSPWVRVGGVRGGTLGLGLGLG